MVLTAGSVKARPVAPPPGVPPLPLALRSAASRRRCSSASQRCQAAGLLGLAFLFEPPLPLRLGLTAGLLLLSLALCLRLGLAAGFLLLALAFGLGFGLTTRLLLALALGLGFGLETGLLLTLAFGFGLGLTAGLLLALAFGLGLGLTAGLLLALALGLGLGLAAHLRLTLALGLGFGLAARLFLPLALGLGLAGLFLATAFGLETLALGGRLVVLHALEGARVHGHRLDHLERLVVGHRHLQERGLAERRELEAHAQREDHQQVRYGDRRQDAGMVSERLPHGIRDPPPRDR
jgi:hypothetical protein